MRPLTRLGALGALGVFGLAAALLLSFGLRAIGGTDPGPATTPGTLAGSPSAAATERPNVVLIVSDDQRWDKVTPEYTPNLWALGQEPDAVAFTNGFVSNPLCCPSRATILSGQYSHTTGVWGNWPPHGGFGGFRDEHTLAVDFQEQGYRTALIGKYLNGYRPGISDYVPPGWDTWFAVATAAYYDYEVTTESGFESYGDDPEDYIARVLERRAREFVADAGDDLFFLYLSFTAPHTPSWPDVRDIGRFDGDDDLPIPGPPELSMLASAYSMDRAIGAVLDDLPENTVVFFLSDNGYIWHEPHAGGEVLQGKSWPYDPSIRVPMIIAGLDHAVAPLRAGRDDLVVNVDLRASLLHAAGLEPLTPQEGLDWFATDYAPRGHVLLEHATDRLRFAYCGIRTLDALYVRFADGKEEFFDYTAEGELRNLADLAPPGMAAMRQQAIDECVPTPPWFSW